MASLIVHLRDWGSVYVCDFVRSNKSMVLSPRF